MEDPAIQIAETIQTASINREPSVTHDINPPTSIPEKQPAVERTPSDAGSIPSDLVDHHRVLRSAPRRHTLPPLPDLRFEQSYLASLRGADTWGRVAWITIRDQVRGLQPTPFSFSLVSCRPADQFSERKSMSDSADIQVLLPLVQGTLWTLALSGWRFWNRTASLGGQTLGSRVRRWWYGVNNWKLPPRMSKNSKVAAQVEDFYTAQFSNAGAD
ncbi:DUF1770-domain-containing protein [Aspergillus varians]